jgi:hypothetical protein
MTTAREVFEKTAAAAAIARGLPQPLRRFYQLGQRASAQSKAQIKNIAVSIGLSQDYVRKSRLFAQRMTDTELRLLAATYRDHGYQFPWGHLRILVSVQNPRRRHAYLTSAINNGWSARALIAAVQLGEQRTQRKCVGRKQTKPQSVEEALLRLQRLMESWIDVYEQAFEGDAAVAAPKKLKARIGLAQRTSQVQVFQELVTRYQAKVENLGTLLGQCFAVPQPSTSAAAIAPTIRKRPKRG